VPGNQVAWQRNRVARRVYELDRAWALYVDADVVPQPGALAALLGTGLPLVSGVVLERVWPFEVCALRSLEPHERWLAPDVLAHREPFPVPAVGTGCLLVRRAVLDAVALPWFRCGQVNPEVLAEDLDFSLRAAAAGFPPYLHPRVLAGHRTDVILWPGAEESPMAQWADAEGRLPWREPVGPVPVKPTPVEVTTESGKTGAFSPLVKVLMLDRRKADENEWARHPGTYA